METASPPAPAKGRLSTETRTRGWCGRPVAAMEESPLSGLREWKRPRFWAVILGSSKVQKAR